MLRSIFSLIQRIIIDSDREYNNKKSGTVIYLVSKPDQTVSMDWELEGNPRQKLKMIRERDSEAETSNSFQITTDKGDTVTCRHTTDKMIKAKPRTSKGEEKMTKEYRRNVEVVGDKATFSNDDDERDESDKKYAELQGEVGINVRELLATLPQKKVVAPEKDKEQLGALLEQIKKMKKGMERLHQIAKQFTCSEKFKQDIDFLVKNLTLDKGDAKNGNLTPKKPA